MSTASRLTSGGNGNGSSATADDKNETFGCDGNGSSATADVTKSNVKSDDRTGGGKSENGDPKLATPPPYHAALSSGPSTQAAEKVPSISYGKKVRSSPPPKTRSGKKYPNLMTVKNAKEVKDLAAARRLLLASDEAE